MTSVRRLHHEWAQASLATQYTSPPLAVANSVTQYLCILLSPVKSQVKFNLQIIVYSNNK
jgi:hypothetical protein